MNAYAIILAGGNGERFWPVSTPERPKQFVDLFDGKPLIRHAVDRLDGLVPSERIFVITAARFVEQTRAALPMLAADHIIAEPCRRDTAAAVATACGLVLRQGGPDAVGCILTSDHLITPVETFRATLADTIAVAAAQDAIVTMGITPTRPETGYGYIACGARATVPVTTLFHAVERFVEKPSLEKAVGYLQKGGYLWNSGMFVWSARTMQQAFRKYAPDFGPLIETVAASRENPTDIIARLYPSLRTISVDFAVMEHAESILVAESRFAWDDVGSWRALENHFPQDAVNNICLGRTVLRDVSDSVIVNTATDDHLVAVMGLTDAVVVQTDHATLVCRKSDLPQMRALVRDCTAASLTAPSAPSSSSASLTAPSASSSSSASLSSSSATQK